MPGDQDKVQKKEEKKVEKKPKTDDSDKLEKAKALQLEIEQKALEIERERKALEEKLELENKVKEQERIIKSSKEEYSKALKVIEDVYYRFYGGEKFKYKLKDITDNLDEYFEAIALKFAKCDIGSETFERISKVVESDKLGISTGKVDNNRIEEIIKKYPIAIMMTGGVDLKKDLRLSTKLISHIEKAVCLVVRAESGIFGGESIDNLFKPLYAFLTKQGIKL